MSCQKLQQVTKMTSVILFLAGCSILITEPRENLYAQQSLFKFIKTVQVTPDDQFLTGCFVRIHYVPANDRFVVIFDGNLAKPSGKYTGAGNSYKEYTMDMQATGKFGTFAGEPFDEGSVMVGNTLYFAVIQKQSEQCGWHLLKIDATNWTTLIDKFYPVDAPREFQGDPMLAFINGQLDISSLYTVNGESPGLDTPAGDYGTHHNFFSTDLQFQEKKILTEPPHINGSYMVYLEGVYYLVTANLFDGDVLVAKYDKDWKYLGGKTLINQAHFSTGLVYDGQRFYLAYTDTRQRTEPTFFPVFLNIHLAAFDRDWNLLDDVAVTSYTPQDGMGPGRPWVILHENRLYVSYDVDTADPITHEEHQQWQAYVSVYELQGPSAVKQNEQGPKEFRLEQNYPNPFNSSTTIRFELPKASHVCLSIYNLLGQEIAVLADEKRMEGIHEVCWNGLDARHVPAPSGAYLYRLESAPYFGTGKLLLLK